MKKANIEIDKMRQTQETIKKYRGIDPRLN